MQTYKLNGETIDIISDSIEKTYRQCGCTKKETIRAKLLIEEALLKYRSKFGEDIELYFRQYAIFGQIRFTVRLMCPSFDPFTLEENPMAFMIKSIMSSFENGIPTWKYRNLENEIVFVIHKKAKLGSFAKIGIGVGISLILGIILRIFVAGKTLTPFVTDYIQPITNAYAGLFCVMAVLMTMFAITLSIVHVGDMSSAGVMGGRMLRRFFGLSALSVIVLTAPILPFFKYVSGGEYSIAAKSLYDVFIGFIPTNLVSPFLNFNSVHIMVIGAMFGFSLLVMGQKGETLTEVFDECNIVAILTNNFLNKFISVYVALNVFSIITTSNFRDLAGAGKMVGAILIAVLVLFAAFIVYGLIKTKMKPGEFFKFLMPTFFICVSSANFGAAFSTIADSLLAKDVPADTMSLSVNLGCVFFKPASTLTMIFSTLFMASKYGIAVSPVWVVISVVMSFILVSAMPNIPGALVSVITVVYAQLGLPAEAVALMIAINAILQFVTVAVDTCCMQIITIGFASTKAEEKN